jgi:rod shape-determining protein MreD
MAFKSKIREALVIGLITGLLMDCLYGSLIGPYAILLMYLAVISSLINHGPLKDKIIYLLLMALPCSILFIFGDAFLSSLLKMMISGSGILFTNFFLTVKTIIFPRIWYTYIMFFVLFFPLYMSKKFVSKMDAKLFAEKNYGGWKG